MEKLQPVAKVCTSAELIDIAKRWWILKQQRQHQDNVKEEKSKGFYVRTNYPYVYKRSKKQKHIMDKNRHFIYIPPLHLHSRESVYEVYKMLMRDIKMPYYGLMAALGIDIHDNKSLENIYRVLQTYLRRKRVQDREYYDEARKDMDTRQLYYQMCEKNWFMWYRLLFDWIITNWRKRQQREPQEQRISVDSFIAHLCKWIKETWVITQLQEYRLLTTIKLTNGSIVKQIQGRDSVMRRQILSPKIFMLRSQISLRFDLRPNQLVMPKSMIRHLPPAAIANCNLNMTNLFQLDQPGQQLDKFTRLSTGFACIIKRDPVLCKNSIVYIDELAFADTDLLHIGPYSIIGQNADFDGDAENCCLIENSLASMELQLNTSPSAAMYLGQMRLRCNFTETHILYMHQRQLPSKLQRHYQRYEEILKLATVNWLSCIENITSLFNLKQKFPTDLNIFNFIEPTNLALSIFMLSIYVDYGSAETLKVFEEINDSILEISNNYQNNNELPNLYVVPIDECINGKIEPTLLRMVMSGAKGSLHHYVNFLDATKPSINESTDEKDVTDTGDEKFLTRDLRENLNVSHFDIYNKSLDALREIGQAAKNVPANGHESFKTIIEFNGITFTDKQIEYNGTCILPIPSRELFFSHMNFSPQLVQLHFKKALDKIGLTQD